MAIQVAHLTVFISSPENLAAERKIIQDAAFALNPVLVQTHHVQFKPYTWKDLPPGVGETAQAIINNQVELCDIYIGVMGSRFGTPTKDAGSGTEEELQRVLARFKQLPKSVRVLFYFKTSESNIFDIDLAQLSKVVDFKRKVGSSGVLYQEFSDHDALRKAVTDHLTQITVEQWGGEGWTSMQESAPEKKETQQAHGTAALVDKVEETETEPAGMTEDAEILDALVYAQTAFGASAQPIFAMAATLRFVEEGVRQRTATYNQGAGTASELLLLANGVADDLTKGSIDLLRNCAAYRGASSEGFDALERGIELYVESGFGTADQLGEFVELLASIETQILGGRDSMERFRQVVNGTPNFSRRYRVAKRKLSEALDEVGSTFTSSIARIRALQEKISNEPPDLPHSR